MNSRKKAMTRLALAALLLMVITIAIVVMTGPKEARTTRHIAGSTAGHVPERVVKRFALLRGPAEGLPMVAREAVVRSGRAVEPDFAQVLAVSPDPAWLVTGANTVCLVTQEQNGGPVGVTCRPLAATLKSGIYIAAIADGGPEGSDRTVLGVVPDGVRGVYAVTRGANKAFAEPHAGVFLIRDTTASAPDYVRLIRDRPSHVGQRGSGSGRANSPNRRW
jgi:hypothetical protein